MLNEYILSELQKQYKVTARDMGDLAKVDKSGMHFRIQAYNVEGVGNLCLMDMKGMLGLMKMTTAVLTPLDVDLPMFSNDAINAMGNDSLYLEIYNTCMNPWDDSRVAAVKKEGESLPAFDPGAHWYDNIRYAASDFKKGKKIKDRLDVYGCKYIEAFLEEIRNAAPCDRKAKLQRQAEYTEAMIAQGGPAVNQFKKMLGEEKTAEFLRKYMFTCVE